jgi:hypothetical protein
MSKTETSLDLAIEQLERYARLLEQKSQVRGDYSGLDLADDGGRFHNGNLKNE